MLYGLGVPLLRSLWGAVRNWQLYILRMYCKSCISFSFSIFLKQFARLTAKKNYTHLPQKKFIFLIIYKTYREKKIA